VGDLISATSAVHRRMHEWKNDYNLINCQSYRKRTVWRGVRRPTQRKRIRKSVMLIRAI